MLKSRFGKIIQFVDSFPNHCVECFKHPVLFQSRLQSKMASLYEHVQSENRLLQAVTDRSIETILKHEEDVNFFNIDGVSPLILAINDQYKEGIDALLKKGAKVNLASRSGEVPLEYAIKKKNLWAVDTLISHGAVLTSPDGTNKLLDLATQARCPHIVSYLVEKGVSVNSKIDYGQLPLQRAIRNQNDKLIKLLIEKGANVNAVDSEGHTPLTLAVYYVVDTKPLFGYSPYESELICKILIKNGAKINLIGKGNKTPLAWAFEHNYLPAIQLLVSHGADVNVVDTDGQSSLMHAIKNYNATLDIFEYLVSVGANVNALDNFGNTALSLAIKHDRTDIAKYLIEIGANVCKVAKNATTPLGYAVQNCDKDVIRMLLDYGAAVAINSAFLAAIQNKQLEMVEFLIEKGASVNVVYSDGSTPLFQSYKSGNEDVTKYLIDNGAKVTDPEQLPSLFEQIEKRNLRMVKHMVKLGTCVNTCGESGHTPLTKCAQLENFEILKFLVEHGANVNQTDVNNKTPLSIAAANKDLRSAHLLIHCGADIRQAAEEVEELAEGSEDFKIYLRDVTNRSITGSAHMETNESK